MSARRIAALVLALAAVVLPVAAQDKDDEELEEQRRRDEKYLERRNAPPDAAAPADAAAAARQFVERADRLIRDKNYRSAEGPRYRIQTDDPRLDLAAVGGLLDAFAGFFDGVWPVESAPAAPAEPARVFLFYSFHKYNQLLQGDFSRELVRPVGHYGSALDALVIHTDAEGGEGLPQTLVHEAAHQLVHRRFYPGEARASTWADEGLATYFGNTFMDSERKFHAGVVGGKRIALLRGAREEGRTDARARLARVRQALERSREGGPSAAALLVSADEPAEFYGEGVLERYDLSWVLVHYLLHGDGGRHAEGFRRFLALDAAGRGDAAALERETGLELRTLDAALAAHLKTIEVR